MVTMKHVLGLLLCVLTLVSAAPKSHPHHASKRDEHNKHVIKRESAAIIHHVHQDNACPDGWFYFNNYCYHWSGKSVTKTWFQAQFDCRIHHANLVSIHDKIEQEHTQAITQCVNHYWIGMVLTDANKWTTPAMWQWWDGTRHDPTKFTKLKLTTSGTYVGYLNCAYGHSGGNWLNQNCRTHYSYLCKKPASGPVKPTVSENSTDTGRCPSKWNYYRNNCYYASEIKANYFHAQLSCQESGAKVVTIHTQEEQAFVQALHGCNENVWIGLERARPCVSKTSTDCWEWTDLKPLKHSNWASGHPSGASECVFNKGFWYSYGCNYQFKYVCKKPAKPELD